MVKRWVVWHQRACRSRNSIGAPTLTLTAFPVWVIFDAYNFLLTFSSVNSLSPRVGHTKLQGLHTPELLVTRWSI